jgi:hypothetical protein
MMANGMIPKFKGNFTIHTKNLSTQQQSEVMQLAITENLQWAIRADSKKQDAFIMIHTPNPMMPTQQRHIDKNMLVMGELVRHAIPFVWTHENQPKFHQDIKDALENNDRLSSVGVTEIKNQHDIWANYSANTWFGWKPFP